MIGKIIYYMRLICLFFYIVLSVYMLPYVFQTGYSGYFFLITLIVFISIILYTLLSKLSCYKKTISYNLIIIALTFYLGVVSSRIFLTKALTDTSLYTLSLDYCKNNFVILSLVMIGIILNTFVLRLMEEK